MPIDKKDIPVTDRAVTMEKIIALCKNSGVICISEVIDISPGNLNSSL